MSLDNVCLDISATPVYFWTVFPEYHINTKKELKWSYGMYLVGNRMLETSGVRINNVEIFGSVYFDPNDEFAHYVIGRNYSQENYAKWLETKYDVKELQMKLLQAVKNNIDKLINDNHIKTS
jgi:hypothetical protein